MPRKPYHIRPYDAANVAAGYDIHLTIEADLITEQELVSAPGVGHVISTSDERTNPSLAGYIVMLDPLYETKEEALAELQAWLEERRAKPLDNNVWGQE